MKKKTKQPICKNCGHELRKYRGKIQHIDEESRLKYYANGKAISIWICRCGCEKAMESEEK